MVGKQVLSEHVNPSQEQYIYNLKTRLGESGLIWLLTGTLGVRYIPWFHDGYEDTIELPSFRPIIEFRLRGIFGIFIRKIESSSITN